MNGKSLVTVVLLGLGACSSEDPDPELYRQACDAGAAASCYTLGFWHETGLFGITKDLARARGFYEQACDGGEMPGCYALATMYETGEGVAQDLARALSLYQEACDGGEMPGCYTLATMYETGEAVPQDLARALGLYQRACDGGGMGCSKLDMLDEVPEREVYRTPYTAAPYILNPWEVLRAKEREYPQHLRQAGATGTVAVYFFIDKTGTVQDIRIDHGSGDAAFDAAALRVAGVHRFGAAMYGLTRVPVWWSLPITFEVR